MSVITVMVQSLKGQIYLINTDNQWESSVSVVLHFGDPLLDLSPKYANHLNLTDTLLSHASFLGINIYSGKIMFLS